MGRVLRKKKVPKTIKQWAREADEALLIAVDLVKKKYPKPSETEKMELIRCVSTIVATFRNLKDKKKIDTAYKFVMQAFKDDLERKEPDEPIYWTISFYLSYLDVHAFLGYITEKQPDKIMDYMSGHDEYDYEEKL